MWTRMAAFGLCRSAFASKSSNDMQRSSRLQSTNSTSAPAPIAASGVAMKVFDGQRTVSPWTPANSRAARAPPAQLDIPTLGSPFQTAQRASKASSFAALRPLLGVEHLGPELEQPAAVAVVEPDRELRRVGPGCLRGAQERRKASTGGRLGSLDQLCSCADLEHRADRLRAGQEHGAGDRDGHAGDEDGAVERSRPPGLVEDQRREDDRDQDLDREHHRRHPGRRAALQGAHLAEQREALRSHRGRQPGRRRPAPCRPRARR